VIAGLWIAELLLFHLIAPPPTTYPDTAIFRLFEVMGAITLTVSLGLFWYARRSGRGPRFLLNLGLLYEVLIALSVGLLDWAYNPPVGLSWMTIIILIFAAIIPAPPAKTLVVALLAASMSPAGALIWKAAGQQHVPGAGEVFLHAFPNYLCALIAPLISHIITSLGREVKKARAMGSYVLDSMIGAGGMGEVWRANHRFLARPAAIKLIKPEVLGSMTKEQREVLVERFRREAQAAALLRSPHTIHLYDFGVTGDGTFYYVMELLDGMDLQTLVSKHGPLPPGRTIFLRKPVGGTWAGPGASRHQTRQHPGVPHGRLLRLGEGARLWSGEDYGRRRRGGGPHGASLGHRYAGLYLARERAGGASGPPDRHLRARLRGVLDAHRPLRLHRRHRAPDRRPPHFGPADCALETQQVRHLPKAG
jgi:hypothetical protein